MQQFDNLADAQTLALAIVDTFPEPFLVLDDGLRVLAASRCFYEVFKEDPERAHGRLSSSSTRANGMCPRSGGARRPCFAIISR